MDAGISAGASSFETGEERGTRVSNHEAIDTWPGPA